MIEKILEFKEKFNKVFQSKSHAIILQSEDLMVAKNVALLFSAFLCCESENKPCMQCASCKKVIDGNSLDTITYFDKVLMVEDVENIVENLSMTPAENEYKVIIIDNFDEVSLRVQNKILKSLEEPPKFVKFVLLVKTINSLLPTVISRCETIMLPKFEDKEMLKILGNEFTGNLTLIAIENACGNFGRAMEMINNNQFLSTFNLCLEMLEKMTNSSKILEYSSKIIKNKDNFELFILILENLFEDLLFIKNDCDNLIKNKFSEERLKNISSGFSSLSIVNIIEYIEKIKEKIKFNVNFNLIVDALLLHILEVKFKCK